MFDGRSPHGLRPYFSVEIKTMFKIINKLNSTTWTDSMGVELTYLTRNDAERTVIRAKLEWARLLGQELTNDEAHVVEC